MSSELCAEQTLAIGWTHVTTHSRSVQAVEASLCEINFRFCLSFCQTHSLCKLLIFACTLVHTKLTECRTVRVHSLTFRFVSFHFIRFHVSQRRCETKRNLKHLAVSLCQAFEWGPPHRQLHADIISHKYCLLHYITVLYVY